MLKHLEISTEKKKKKMDGKYVGGESWMNKKFSNVFFLDESILQFLQKNGTYCLLTSNTAP